MHGETILVDAPMAANRMATWRVGPATTPEGEGAAPDDPRRRERV